MKTILVPTDFSPTAVNAVRYAHEISAYFNMALKLVHVFLPTPSTDYEPVTEPFLRAEQINREKLLRMAKSLDTATNGGGVEKTPVCWELLFGFPAEEVISYSKKDECALIIMGATGESGPFEKLFGKVSAHVATHAHCPVLLIPNDRKFKPFQNILYTTNDPQLDTKMLTVVTQLVEIFRSCVHLLHVGEEEEFVPARKLKEMLKERMEGIVCKQSVIQEESVAAGIEKYVSQEDVDLVIMATRHRNLWQNLLHRSVSKQLAFAGDVPLLLFHEKDQKVL